jgi:hypothetical protein
MSRLSGGIGLMLLAASAAAAPSNSDMARCAAIPAPDSRLACYDALAHRPADKAPSAAAVVPAARAPTAPVPTASVPAPLAPSAASAPEAAAAQAPTPAAAAAADPKNFGLTPAQQHTTDLGPKSIAAQISNVSSDQIGRTLIVLDNGETWTVTDNDGRLSSGDAVTIKKAALGSFLMFTASNHSYRVRRIK